jgi:hypothetical protein
VGVLLRRVGPELVKDQNFPRSFIIILLLTVVTLSSILMGSTASDQTSSISANCDECHAPSIYLVVEIQFIDAPAMIVRNQTALIDLIVEVSASHKSYVWSGFGMDVWLAPGTDHTDCGPHQIVNGQKPQGSTSPYSWTRTFTFMVNSSFLGNETITINARMSPIHESPPVTAREVIVVPIVASSDSVLPPAQNEPVHYDHSDPEGKENGSKLGPFGLLIIILGAVGVLAGISYSIYSLLSPMDKREQRKKIQTNSDNT